MKISDPYYGQGNPAETSAGAATSSDAGFIAKALKRMTAAKEADDHNRESYTEDLKFYNGEQWSDTTRQERDNEGRPSLTINCLPDFVDTVLGDLRLNRPRIKTRAVGGNASIEMAKIFDGLIRNIEYESKAEEVYDSAAEEMAIGGLGAWRVNTKYVTDDVFDQDIVLEWIPNPLSVYFEPRPFDIDKSDANWAFITFWMTREDFKEKYPDVPAISIPEVGRGDAEGWFAKDKIKLAEYFIRKPVKKVLVQLSDGSIMEEKKARIRRMEAGLMALDSGHPDLATAQLEVLNSKEVETYEVERYIICGTQVLEGPQKVPCSIIPIVMLYGKMVVVEGKRYYRGIVRNAKDPQRLYNYWRSAETEFVSMQPKNPWMVTPAMIEGHEAMYRRANRRNEAYLLYNPDPTNPMAKPERQQPPTVSPGFLTGAERAFEDLKRTTAMFDPSIGLPSPGERTGALVKARQAKGDMSNFSYADNMVRALRLTGRILVDMIPRIYDTSRIVRIIQSDDKEATVPINMPGHDQDGSPVIVNNLAAGKYDIMVDTGPNFHTARAEAREGMVDFGRAYPQAAPLIMDLVAKMQDWPYAQEIAERLNKVLPPQMQDNPPPPQPPTPQQQMEGLKLQRENTKVIREKIRVMQDVVKLQQTKTGGDRDIKKTVLDTLSEVFAPEPNQTKEMPNG
jgi:hypothetical protein